MFKYMLSRKTANSVMKTLSWNQKISSLPRYYRRGNFKLSLADMRLCVFTFYSCL